MTESCATCRFFAPTMDATVTYRRPDGSLPGADEVPHGMRLVATSKPGRCHRDPAPWKKYPREWCARWEAA